MRGDSGEVKGVELAAEGGAGGELGRGGGRGVEMVGESSGCVWKGELAHM